MEIYWSWFQDHLLAVVAIIITLVLVYHYLIEWDTGVKLSKRYRNSIFEAQSKIFLNVTQYLISGNKDLAIKEFLNAVDVNRETIETYFALGGLFRSNGEMEKAISIHRSLIARDNISESTRLRALKELAIDFDKGGFIDKAVDTYLDVLKVNRDQSEVVSALCRIYEDIEEWDDAYRYRLLLSKISNEDQSETISHILVEKSKKFFLVGEFQKSNEVLEDAYRYAPSVSAKILNIKLSLIYGKVEDAEFSLRELLKEFPMYASFIFIGLHEEFKASKEIVDEYRNRVQLLESYFLKMNDRDILDSPSVILSKIRLFKETKQVDEAYKLLGHWISNQKGASEVLKMEYIKLLIEMGKTEEAIVQTTELLGHLNKSLTKHYCQQCGYNSDDIFWRCPQCHQWETIQFRWMV